MKMLFALVCALLVAPVAQAIEGSSRIQRVISPGGIEAWLVEEHAIPMIAVEIGFSGGARLDPEGKEGAAYLTAGLIEEGAGDMDAQVFQRRLEDLAARMSFENSRDDFYVGMRALTENRDESFELLRIALTEPRFDPKQVERVRQQVISGLKSATVDPNKQASKAWMKGMFGDSIYGRSTKGEIETVEALTRDDIVAVYDRMVAKNRMIIGVVGDIDAPTLSRLLDETFGDLPVGEELDNTPIEVRQEGGLDLIRSEIPQSVAVFGHRGILRDDPDFIPAYVMNYIFGGGGFESRLTTEVREKNGLAYSVYSYLSPLDRAGLYLGGVATANERVAQSLDLIRKEWRRMSEEGVTEEELERAKKYLTGAYALRFDSNAKIARYLVGLQGAGLGIDYIDERNGLVEAVTVEDIARVAERLLQPDDLYIVVVGNPDNLETD